MQRLKKTLLVGATVATFGLSSLGIASAATSSSTDGSTSLVDKIASTFNLDKSKVQAVFDEDRTTHETQMKADRATALKQAVTDGKLTQTQADYITKAWADIDALHSTDGTKPTDAQREAMKAKMDALRTWLSDQKIDLQSIDGLGGFGRHGGFGGPRGGDGSSNSTSSSSSSSNG